MVTVGIRELKQQASELVRRVRESGQAIQITYHGKVVAQLIPVEPQAGEDEARAWEALDELAARIGRRWSSEVSAAGAVNEDRQE